MYTPFLDAGLGCFVFRYQHFCGFAGYVPNFMDRWVAPETSQNIGFIGFLIDTLVRIPCKTTKLPSQHVMLGHHRPASMAFCWRADDGPLTVVFGSLSSHQLKNEVKVGLHLKKKLSGSAHAVQMPSVISI